MTYNREIGHFAPLPSGPLPTQREIATLTQTAKHSRNNGLIDGLREVFGG